MMDDFDDLLAGVTGENNDTVIAELNKKIAEQQKLIEAQQTEINNNKQALDNAFNASGSDAEAGKPILVDIDLVIENPDKPNVRSEVDEEFENWLTENIKEQFARDGFGIQDPISVFWSEEHNKWIINKGHTRRKCGERAGLKKVPVIIQDSQNDWNQVIENIIRKGLSTFDMCEFLRDKKDEGLTNKDIGERLSRDKGWVSKHLALLDPPDSISLVWRSGQATDFSTLYEMITARKVDPEKFDSLIMKLASSQDTISRSDVSAVKKTLTKAAKEEEENDNNNTDDNTPTDEPKTKTKLVLEVKDSEQTYIVLFDKPSREGCLLLENENGDKVEKEISSLIINQLKEV